jgi:predicted RNA-binding protein associated with RNAse of E/G family
MAVMVELQAAPGATIGGMQASLAGVDDLLHFYQAGLLSDEELEQALAELRRMPEGEGRHGTPVCSV